MGTFVGTEIANMLLPNQNTHKSSGRTVMSALAESKIRKHIKNVETAILTEQDLKKLGVTVTI